MIRRSERLRVASKVVQLERDDPERWGAVAFLLEELAEAEEKIEALCELASRTLGYATATGDRARASEVEEERAILAQAVHDRLSPADVARLTPADFSSSARQAVAAVVLACHDCDARPTPERILRVLALDGEGSAVAVAAGVELERLPAPQTLADLPTFLQHSACRRSAAHLDRAARLLRLRSIGPARDALWEALALLEDVPCQ